MAVAEPEIVAVEPEQEVTIEESEQVTIETIREAQQLERVSEPDNRPVGESAEPQKKVSAFSLASIRAKKELQAQAKAEIHPNAELPTEAFNETDMLLYWTRYAQKIGEKGLRIMESLLLINDPVLDGTRITIELPNAGSKQEFESEKPALLGYLKGHLHNHDITIEVVVNEVLENKFAFTAQDKYNRLNELNPNLEILRKTFDLDI